MFVSCNPTYHIYLALTKNMVFRNEKHEQPNYQPTIYHFKIFLKIKTFSYLPTLIFLGVSVTGNKQYFFRPNSYDGADDDDDSNWNKNDWNDNDGDENKDDNDDDDEPQ